MKAKLNRKLTVRVITQQKDKTWFDQQMADHHYLGAGRPVGDYLRQCVYRDDKPIALFVWGPSSYALKDRDLWIGWSANHRVERLKLIVQNRRFLLLSKKGAEPNLASQAMGVVLRALPEQWHQHFGYRPLLAESFTDREAYHGTCYKASNWEAVGTSAGYSRHRADFYIANDRPKRLWMKELTRDAKRLIRATELPSDSAKGCIAPPSGVLPISQAQLPSLRATLSTVTDPRRNNTRYRTGSVLTIIAMALLAGRREIAEIARFATTLRQPQRRLLGLPRKKQSKAFYQVPGYSVFYEVLRRLDPEVFASALAPWLQQRVGILPGGLAMDGKMIRDQIGLLSLAQHEDGAPQAVAVYDQKEHTPRCEQTAAANLLATIPCLDGKIITADALHCQRNTARVIVEKGGEYLLKLKNNQPNFRLLDLGRGMGRFFGI